MAKNFESDFGVDTDRDYHSGLNDAIRPIATSDSEVEAPSDLPLHPEHLAAEPNDAGAPRAELESVEKPVQPWNADPNVARELGDFARFVAAMRDSDYGDWMRRANVYWEALHDNLLRSLNSSADALKVAYIEREMAALKEDLQYRPNWKVAETQRAVVLKALEMRRRLTGIDDINIHDLEIATSTVTPNEVAH